MSHMPAPFAALLAPAARSDAAEMPNGFPGLMTETNQGITSFGNSPMMVSGGLVSHTWNGSTSNSAGYMQTRPTPGATCTRVGAIVRAPVGSVSDFVLVLPSSAWADGNLTAAGVHYVVETNGHWEMSYWDGASVNLYGQGDIEAWNDNTERRVEVSVDVSTSTVTVQHPDGSTDVFTDSRIAAHLSEYCVWELFAVSGVGEVSPPKILRFWGDAAEEDWRGSVSQIDLARAASATLTTARGVDADTFIDYAPAVQFSVATTVASANVISNIVFAIVTPGRLGKVLVEASAYYEFAAGDTLFWSATAGAVTCSAIAAHVGAIGEKKLVRQMMLITGLTPDVPVTVSFNHWTINNGSATLIAGGAAGAMKPPIFLRATSVV